MNSSAHRYRRTSARAFLLAVALIGTGLSAHASDAVVEGTAPDPGTWATTRVTNSLTHAIDATVSHQATRTVSAQPRQVASEPAVAPTRRLTVAEAMPAPLATAGAEHTRLYLAIKDGAQSGVLVQ